MDPEHPHPSDARRWLPATVHPPGYSLLLLLLYRTTNYTWMIRSIHVIQTAADALAGLLLYFFVRNLFGSNPALVALWIYALLPSPIVLTLRLQPDAFSCFFAAAILALATYIQAGGARYALLTGAVVGLASQFRAEFILWSVIILCALAVSPTSGRAKLRLAAAVLVAQFVVLLPYAFWAKRVTGHPLLAPSDGGSTMYQALGEKPQNPWGITLQDQWIEADAVKRGFSSAWSPEAEAFYRSAFFAAIQAHPVSFLKLIVIHRLPVALVPPFSSGRYNPSGFNLWDIQKKEGLTRWGVMLKYPRLVFTNLWPLVLMAMLSFVLLVGMLTAVVLYRRDWDRIAWIVIPWLITVSALSFAKQIEPRNLSTIIVPEVAAVALLVSYRRGLSPRRQSMQAPSVSAGTLPDSCNAVNGEIRKAPKLSRDRKGAGWRVPS